MLEKKPLKPISKIKKVEPITTSVSEMRKVLNSANPVSRKQTNGSRTLRGVRK